MLAAWRARQAPVNSLTNLFLSAAIYGAAGSRVYSLDLCAYASQSQANGFPRVIISSKINGCVPTLQLISSLISSYFCHFESFQVARLGHVSSCTIHTHQFTTTRRTFLLTRFKICCHDSKSAHDLEKFSTHRGSLRV